MKKFLGYTTTDTAFSSALLLLRLLVGGMMLVHGIGKIMAFEELSTSFPEILPIGAKFNLMLAIFAEVGCSIALIFGLLIRLSVLPLIFTMLMAVLVIHGKDPFAIKELAILYLGLFTFFFITGGGRFSLDRFIFK